MASSPPATVQHAIVHITDRSAAQPVYSEIELDLDANPPLRDYFTGQVQNALSDSDTGAAKFVATGPQDAKNACMRILRSHAGFVPESQRLAQLLYTAIGTDRRIAPGSLAVCVYTAGKSTARHLALIKLDPGAALVQKVVKREGKQLVSFEVSQNVMPTAREKLHKAALVPPAGSEKYDLLLLDHQTADVAATFWRVTFLNAEAIVDGRIGARDFKDAGHKAHDRLLEAELITPDEAEQLRDHVLVALQTPRVRLSAFVQNLPFEDDAKEVVEEELEKKFHGTKTIPIDARYAADKIAKKIRKRGDYGFLMEVEADHYHDVVKSEELFEGPNKTPMTRLVLEVPRLQWVK